ncbi:MAG: diguanylate cyclase [Nitrospiraceae bacterium]|nr:diguanylate cyclase [Nitrospiraceae bacterium]MDA8090821.1 diguanylate cyclase [Nitrospiraceae bacterium]
MDLTGLFKKKIVIHCLDYINMPVAVVDEDGRVAELNEALCALLDMGRKDLMGIPLAGIEKISGVGGELGKSLKTLTAQTGRIKLDERIFNVIINPIWHDGGRLFGVVFDDVTKFIELESELVKRNKLLMVINTISTAFIYSDEISSVFGKLIEKIQLVTDLGICWISLKDDGEKFTLKAAAGLSRDLRQKLEEGAFDDFQEMVTSLKEREPFYVLEEEEIKKYPGFSDERIVFLVALPLSIGPDKVGVLALGSRAPVSMGFDLASLIHLIGNHVSLIIEKVRLYENARYLAVTDALTGIFNIRYFYDSLALEVARAKRYGTNFSVTIFDVDDFKAINDTYGHQAGDEVLRRIASAIRKTSRETDIAARYGGEEFVIIQTNTTKAEAFKQAVRVKNAIESEYYIDQKIRISISGGVAAFPEDGSDEKSLLYAADMALYEAKGMGKRQIRLAGGSGKNG